MFRERPTFNAYRRTPSATRSPDGSLARRAEICRQAFFYLGGWPQASRFLNQFDADLDDKPVNIAMASRVGMLVVSSKVQRLVSAIQAMTDGDAPENAP